ncbi:MAG: hypothetical protein WC725_01915 [Patescibacteria group bacterium]|jgi:hypothetical protein
MKKVEKILRRTDVGLIQFFVYIFCLGVLVIKGYGFLSVVYVHVFFVMVYGTLIFWDDFLRFFLSPIFAIIIPIQDHLIHKYINTFEQNIPAETVIVLGQSDWFKLEAWIKHNYLKSEIVALVELLKIEGKRFSFYTMANVKDIEKIMSDKSIKEVYFFGHGDSHVFQLSTDKIIYYCDYNDREKYSKQFVHQVHCGDPDGKSLIDYVVPEKNQASCFHFRKSIDSNDILKEFKRRTILAENTIKK